MAKNHFGGRLQNLHMEALAAVSRCLRRFYFFKTGTIFYMEALAAVSRCLRQFYFFKAGTCFTQALVGLYRLPPAGRFFEKWTPKNTSLAVVVQVASGGPIF